MLEVAAKCTGPGAGARGKFQPSASLWSADSPSIVAAWWQRPELAQRQPPRLAAPRAAHAGAARCSAADLARSCPGRAPSGIAGLNRQALALNAAPGGKIGYALSEVGVCPVSA